jgi:hypothetical protein
MNKHGTPHLSHRNANGTFKRVPYSLTLKQRYTRRQSKRLSAHFSPSDANLVKSAADDIGVSISDLIATIVMEYCRNSPDFPEIQQKP